MTMRWIDINVSELGNRIGYLFVPMQNVWYLNVLWKVQRTIEYSVRAHFRIQIGCLFVQQIEIHALHDTDELNK